MNTDMNKIESDFAQGQTAGNYRRWLYSLILYLLTPLVLLRLFWRAKKLPAYMRHWQHRFGWIQVPEGFQHGIWIHAVSFGETQAAKPLIARLQELYVDTPILITNSTPTGASLAQHTWGESLFQCYAPYDLPSVVNRFIGRTKPRLAIFMETEIWPNQIHQLQQRGVPILLVNARLSEKSAKGYQRFSALTKDTLNKLTLATVQDEADAARFKSLGMADEKIKVTGSIKSDLFIPPSLVEAGHALRATLGAHRPVVIAASTHEGEETLVLSAFKELTKLVPEVLLILVPR
ncbi:MAG TPA: 3-deoxy-D-manno-octulosonic acid transferase, partial [Gammaproteobacteria bacterium]|nr:3-deoxy-D-manno-octulosonic acid transferase [Gammaproteobacteria bacterium]